MLKEGNGLFNDVLNRFNYSYLALDIWRLKTRRLQMMDYSFRLAASAILYALSHRQESIYYGLCYNRCGILSGMRNSPMKERSDDPTHYERTLILVPCVLKSDMLGRKTHFIKHNSMHQQLCCLHLY